MGSHGLAHVTKEAGTAKAGARGRHAMLTSTQAKLSMEEDRREQSGPEMVSSIMLQADRGIVRELLQRAKLLTPRSGRRSTISSLIRARKHSQRIRPPLSLGKGNAPRSIFRSGCCQCRTE